MMIAGPTEADCDALNKAMVGLGTTERVLSEIIVAATNAELVDIKTSYAAKFDRELIDHINSEISGDYRDFIIACLRGDRVETAAPDATLAAQQAAALRQAAQGWGTNESVFVDILSKASVEQTDLIEQSYEAQFGKSLKAEIKGEMGGDLEWAMLLRLESPLDAQVC
jgi:annexin A7/11